ncbi:MAG: hypothetical protein IH991_21695, partial [Planctomycetes bacterium]|nr:hypothetical protein [Planctomycetota bacterium]
LKLERTRKRVAREVAKNGYMDLALTPVEVSEEDELEIFQITDAAKEAVVKAKLKRKSKERKPVSTTIDGKRVA